MLSLLRVRNFKSIGDSGVELHPKPLTLLMGPNGSGKSSILEAVCILSQSVRQPDFVFDGRLIRYENQHSILHKKEENRIVSITVGFTPPVFNISSWPMAVDSKPAELAGAYSKRINPYEVTQSAFANRNEIATIEFSSAAGSRVIAPPPYRGYSPNTDARLIMNPSSFVVPQNVQAFQDAQSIIQVVGEGLRHVYFLSAVRGDSESFLNAQTGINPDWVGPKGEHTPHILAKFFSLRENQEREELIVKWAERLGLALFKAGWVGGTRLDSDYQDPILGTYLRTPLASYGSRQVLAILAQLFASPPGSLLMIEEPEISLHPESQMLLPELFAEAIRREVQVVITTHSIFLPLSLWRPVESGSLKHDQIAVYHVTKEKEGSRVEEIPVTDKGFLAKWVPSFTKAEEKSIKDLLRLAPQGPSQ